MPQSAFILRPFGRQTFVQPTKMAEQINEVLGHQRHTIRANGSDVVLRPADTASNEHLIDFDAIEKVLIKPALVAAFMRGITTGAVVEASNFREDMFHRLIAADLVIADVLLQHTFAPTSTRATPGVRGGMRS